MEQKDIPQYINDAARDKYRNYSQPFDHEITVQRDAYIQGRVEERALHEWQTPSQPSDEYVKAACDRLKIGIKRMKEERVADTVIETIMGNERKKATCVIPDIRMLEMFKTPVTGAICKSY